MLENKTIIMLMKLSDRKYWGMSILNYVVLIGSVSVIVLYVLDTPIRRVIGPYAFLISIISFIDHHVYYKLVKKVKEQEEVEYEKNNQ
ncbi:hypothetical protein [Bacillus sp. SM2101]|uniref:hypothetical protein n=1 Tax=Bacillaceae TaxID=186817 RepID=UPI001BDEBC05|nr:hypothetical protein [Bacillus sp. SM2101]